MKEVFSNPTIANICKTHHVKRLHLFGSHAENRATKTSDVDLLVLFDEIDLKDYFSNLLSFQEAMQTLFNRKIDIQEEQALRNPYLKASIDKTKQLIYG